MKLNLYRIPFLAVALGVAASAATIATAPLGGYIYYAQCGPNTGSSPCSTNDPAGGVYGGTSIDTASLGLNSVTGPHVAATDFSTYSQGTAISNLDYYIQVNGPAGNVVVDSTYLLSNSVQYSPAAGNNQQQNGSGTAKFGIAGTTLSLELDLAVLDYGGNVSFGMPPLFQVTPGASYDGTTNTYSNSLGGTAQVTLATGQAYLVSIHSTAACNGQGAGLSCTGMSSADPIFSIDPTQPNASLYSFQFSPGVGNGGVAANAPEPASVTMILCGTVALLFLGSRRRVKPQI